MGLKNPLNELKSALIDEMLRQRNGYKIEQINGQRIYHLEDEESLPNPKKGSEVFIGRLPRDCYEDELVPVFEEFGQIRQLRLMMEYDGSNRGYAFVQYMKPSSARMAAKGLDGYKMREKHAIGVMVSWDKRRLFIGGIPKFKGKREVLKEIKRVTEGVKEVILYMSVYKDKNRGFCFVEYKTHYLAAMARQRLVPGFKLWDQYEIRVDWADPEPDIDDEVMKQVKILHVRNLSLAISEDDLKEVFTFDGLHVERVKKIRDFAFIHYETREETEIAFNSTKDNEFVKKYPNMRRTEVSLARPQRNKVLRKRTASAESALNYSSNSESTAGSTQIFYAQNAIQSPQSQVHNELKYYQRIFNPNVQNQMLPVSPYSPPQVPVQVPIKYDSIAEDKNSFNFFVVWVPVVWVPNNQNKDLALTDSTFFCSNNNIIN